MATTYQNFINGAWVDGQTGETSTSTNPANLDEVVGVFQKSNADDAKAAIAAAHEAKTAWGATSGLVRGQYLMKAASYLESNAEEFAQAITAEAGKAILEARGEVGRAIALLQYYGVDGANPVGTVVPSINPNILLYTNRVPLGVVSLITPWNFPLAIPIWKMAPALVYGNTIVLKPASASPLLGSTLR